MRILAIDTSAGASVALWDCEQAKLLASGAITSNQHHAEQLMQLIVKVCAQAGCKDLASAGISYVAVGRGPAPFTGLRAGLITAQVIAFSLGVPCLGVPALDVLALQALEKAEASEGRKLNVAWGECAGEELSCAAGASSRQHVWVCSDARRKEVYAGLYRPCSKQGVKLVGQMQVGKADVLTSQLLEGELVKGLEKPLLFAGPGVQLYPEAFAELQVLPGIDQVDAAALAALAAYRLTASAQTLESLEPLYLRKPDIHGGAK